MSEGLGREYESHPLGKISPELETGPVTSEGVSTEASVPRFSYRSGEQPLAGYTIKRGIGQGGFGEVYYAWSEAGKEVALKLIRRHLEIELRGLRQCLNLKHPNLLSLYDIRQDEQGNYWVIMEYVAGPSLRERIAGWPNGLPVAEVVQWMDGICAGVEYLHAHGIVHRDLKPANIFWEEGIVKIGDYGLSKWIASDQRSGQTENVGTVHYMAPEVAGGRYGKEIDIYALGAILYEMLAGHPPFEGQSAAEVLMKHLTAQPDLRKLPEAFRSVVARALEKDPAHRFTSVRQMAEALRALRPMLAEGGFELARAPLLPSPLQKKQALPGIALTDTDVQVQALAAKVPAKGKWRANPLVQALRAVACRVATACSGEVRVLVWQLSLVLLGTLVFFAAGRVLVPLALVGIVGYGLYGVRGKILAMAGANPSGGIGRKGSPMNIHSAYAGRASFGELPRPPASPYEEAARALRAKAFLQRLTELVGSWVVAAVVSGMMGLVVMGVYGFRNNGQMFKWEQMAWLAVMSIAGSWAVLALSKFWEGTEGEPLLRRLVLLGVGLGLGVLGYGLSKWLWVEWESLANFPRPPQHPLPAQFYGPGGEPLLAAFLANFAAMMAVIRWQRQADPLRFARLNLWSVLVCVLAAALVSWLLRFPQPWLPMWAGMMSLAIQLAAPWSHPRRSHLR